MRGGNKPRFVATNPWIRILQHVLLSSFVGRGIPFSYPSSALERVYKYPFCFLKSPRVSYRAHLFHDMACRRLAQVGNNFPPVA